MSMNKKPKTKAPTSMTMPNYKKLNITPIPINFNQDVDVYDDVDLKNYTPPSRKQAPVQHEEEQDSADSDMDNDYWLFVIVDGERKLILTSNDEQAIKEKIMIMVGSENVEMSNIRLFRRMNVDIGVIIQ